MTCTEILNKLPSMGYGPTIDDTLDFGEALVYAADNECYRDKGYDNFEAYAKENLKLGSRNIYYVMKIVREAKRLGITRNQLRLVGVSNLRQVLGSNLTDKQKLVLLENCVSGLSTTECKAAVKALEGKIPTEAPVKDELLTWMNIKILRAAKEDTVKPAFDKVRRLYGDAHKIFGVPQDISDGKALEMICADYLSGPDANLPWYENFHRCWVATQNTESWIEFAKSQPEDAASLENLLDKISNLALETGIAVA